MSAIDELERYAGTRHRHMGRGELQESDAGLERRIVAALAEHGGAEDHLDELVYEAVGAGSTALANASDDAQVQTGAIGAGERRASAVNNSGIASQVAFLMRAWGAESLLGEVRGLLKPSAPAPTR